MDRPEGRRVRKFDGPSGRGLWIALSGNAYKVSVTSLPYCIIWRNKYSADWLASLASPYAGGRINRSMLSCRDMTPWLSTHSPTAPRRECGGASHQRGMHFLARRAVVWFSDGRKPGCKGFIQNWRLLSIKGRPPSQWNGTIYLPRAEPSTRPGGVSRSRTEPLAPRAVRPGGAISPRPQGVNLREYR